MWSSIERARLPVRSGPVARDQAQEQQPGEHVAGARVTEDVDRAKMRAEHEHRPRRRRAAQQRPQQRAAEQQLLDDRCEHADRRVRAARPRRRRALLDRLGHRLRRLPVEVGEVGDRRQHAPSRTSDSTTPAASQSTSRSQPRMRSGRTRPKSALQGAQPLVPRDHGPGRRRSPALCSTRAAIELRRPSRRRGRVRHRARTRPRRGTARARRPKAMATSGSPQATRAGAGPGRRPTRGRRRPWRRRYPGRGTRPESRLAHDPDGRRPSHEACGRRTIEVGRATGPTTTGARR